MIKNLFNTAGFWLRSNIKFSRRIKKLSNEDKSNLFQDKNASKEEQRVINNYNLADLYNNSSIIQYKENLYTVKLLEDVLENRCFNWNNNEIRVLDIGSKNFSYATGLYKFFSNYKSSNESKRTVYLDGIEIDAYRLMVDLHSRYDYAKYYTEKLVNTRYIVDDYLGFTAEPYHFITLFLPFIVKEPLIKWGIPLKHLQPEKILQHSYELAQPQGIIVVVNQFERERNIQLEIFRGMGLKYILIEEPYNNIFSPYSLKRYISLVLKE